MYMSSESYWDRRLAARQGTYDRASQRVMDAVANAHTQVIKELDQDMTRMFGAFRGRYGLSKEEAMAYLQSPMSSAEQAQWIRRLTPQWLNFKELDELPRISAPAYAARISRVEALKTDCQIRLAEISEAQLERTTHELSHIADTAYWRTTFDVQKKMGVYWGTSGINQGAIDEILKNNWSGVNYSTRIWRNGDEAANKLQQALIEGMMQGEVSRDTFEAIKGQMHAGVRNSASAARRLIVTEANYVSNQAEMRAYVDCGFERYRYNSTFDMSTSNICQSMHGKVYRIADAVPGVNMPPMHPHCRSHVEPMDEYQDMSKVLRWTRGADGKTKYISADMSYVEWRATQVAA